MTTRLAYTRPDGGLSIVTVAPGKSVDRVIARLPADAMDIRQLPDDWEPPKDRTFRSAWKMEEDGAVTVNMPKARDIHREHLRRARKPRIEALDIDYIRALEDQIAALIEFCRSLGFAGTDEALKRIAKRKQALRDVTADPAIDAAQTPDELKAALPAALEAKE